MKVLLITQNYAPEPGAATTRLCKLAETIQDAGHQVTVLTGMPNYPAGRVFSGYRWRFFKTEKIRSVVVQRYLYYTTRRNQNKWKQVASYLSLLPVLVWGGIRSGGADCIIVSSPPIFPAAVAVLLSKWKRAKLVYDIRDLWPDEIIACGDIAEHSKAIAFVRWFERLIYRHADRVACTTQSFMRIIQKRGVPTKKQWYVPNGADTGRFYPTSKDLAFLREQDLVDKCVVLYSGAIGIKHGLEVLLDAAKRLQHLKDLVIVFVGEGAASQQLKALCVRDGLSNVRFLGAFPPGEIPAIINSADICVTALEQKSYLQSILPVKLFEYMSCGKPVVAAVAGESKEMIDACGAGIAVPPGDGDAMADAIQRLFNDRLLALQMGTLGPDFVKENFCRDTVARRFTKQLESLTSEEDQIPKPAKPQPSQGEPEPIGLQTSSHHIERSAGCIPQ